MSSAINRGRDEQASTLARVVVVSFFAIVASVFIALDWLWIWPIEESMVVVLIPSILALAGLVIYLLVRASRIGGR